MSITVMRTGPVASPPRLTLHPTGSFGCGKRMVTSGTAAATTLNDRRKMGRDCLTGADFDGDLDLTAIDQFSSLRGVRVTPGYAADAPDTRTPREPRGWKAVGPVGVSL